MSSRSQLNINIDPDLLKQIKHCALKAEMTIGDYINNIIKCYLTNQDLQAINSSSEDRLKKIEEKLLKTTILLNQIIDSKNNSKINYLNDEDGEIYCKLLAKQFRVIAKDNMISNKQAWINFMNQDEAKKIKPEHIPIIQDTLREEGFVTLSGLIEIVKIYGYCPVIAVFHSMTNGNILPELQILSNKLVANSYE